MLQLFGNRRIKRFSRVPNNSRSRADFYVRSREIRIATKRIMASRLSLALLFLTTLAAVYAANDLIVGSHIPGDHLIQREIAQRPSKFLQIVKLKKTYTGNNRSNITLVRLLDQNMKGNGATANILNGGPGHNFVTVEFKSIRGHSIHFIVELYGR
ncbi:probable salivary secreted peptide [Copidosoma floridanum]|uniref:probable salivary secreted peptide n=1 Tax=Copidosoma floridanum TaxID=29053 RepID=UPI0006C9DC9F|nr:probable salivary secreted peptide [Copidosoma floridanum]